METILVIEDEPALQQLIKFHLEGAGFGVQGALKGDEGFQMAQRIKPALVILDLMLPDIDGMEIARRLKRHPKTAAIPILILSAKGDEIDRVLGLELGADDYVTKPFSPRELILRVKAVLKRGAPPKFPLHIKVGDLDADLARPSVKVCGRPAAVTPLEIKLLQYLFAHRGRVQSRDLLLDQVWGYNTTLNTRTVDVHIKRLRKKLKSAGDLIETVRGLGYRFREV